MWIAHKRGEQYHNTGEVQERKKVTVTHEELMRVIEQNEEIRHEMKESLKTLMPWNWSTKMILRSLKKQRLRARRLFAFWELSLSRFNLSSGKSAPGGFLMT